MDMLIKLTSKVKINVYNINTIYTFEETMHKKLRQMGCSWGLIIPKAILELINVNPVLDEVDLKVVDDKIIITKFKEDK